MPSTPVPLDETDRKILAELSRDARQSVTAIAAAVHVSRAHAYARINRLRDEGVILRFSTVIDPVRAGLQASAYVTLKLQQNTWRELCGQLQAIPAVHHIALVGGNFDVMLLVRAVDTVHLRQVIFEHIQQLPGVVDTQTFLIFEDIDTRA
ncbi:Lrp/AsnC family transcriptional regulator [Kocuria turfanensis]|uniref:AsnC family transcriptional regulator n=2 Tax=Kocuria TaxID=57493 RepID=A0A512IEE0_9MICC|nr:Lrp/AsnC family transcriptional regulator [Kocuria turfanensis]MUN64369.1 AsnC family transcriptional regulator [Kocuria sediminis]GEO96063.1 AsnC family transcriptional regulator [Kocuria turfanensis]